MWQASNGKADDNLENKERGYTQRHANRFPEIGHEKLVMICSGTIMASIEDRLGDDGRLGLLSGSQLTWRFRKSFEVGDVDLHPESPAAPRLVSTVQVMTVTRASVYRVNRAAIDDQIHHTSWAADLLEFLPVVASNTRARFKLSRNAAHLQAGPSQVFAGQNGSLPTDAHGIGKRLEAEIRPTCAAVRITFWQAAWTSPSARDDEIKKTTTQ